MSVVVVDVGNTSTTVALAMRKRMCRKTRVPGKGINRDAVQEAIGRAIGPSVPEGGVISSVVPRLTRMWQRELVEALGKQPHIVSHESKLSVGISYPKPWTIGADRIANACGAAERYGVPSIVADFGSALTFDVISPDRQYIGGVIAPGLSVMTDYLAEKTALLPHIQLRGAIHPVGRSTEGAMRIGAKVGYRGMVREIVEHLEAGYPGRTFELCATGGYARWALEGLDMPFHFDPDLTLFGLTVIYAMNQGDE